MAKVPLIQTLRSQSREQVSAELGRIVAALKDLEVQEAVMRQVLTLIDSNDNGSPDRGEPNPPAQADVEAEPGRENSPPAEDRSEYQPPTGAWSAHRRRNTIVDIMRGRRQSLWSPQEIGRELHERGDQISQSNVRTTLQRMVKIGILVRHQQGLYRLTPAALENHRLEPDGPQSRGTGSKEPSDAGRRVAWASSADWRS